MAEPINVLELIAGAVNGARQSNASLAAAEQKAAGEGKALMDEVAADRIKAGQAKATVVRASDNAKLIEQDQQNKALDAAGGMETFYSVISQLAEGTKRMQGELKAVREEQLATTGFSPLGALKLAVDWSGNRTRLEQSMSELQVLSSAASSLEQRLTQTGQLAKATAKTVTQASIQANADGILAEARIQAAAARIEGIKYGVASFEAAAKADDKELALLTGQANFGRAESQFQLALEEEERRRSDSVFNRTIREEALAEKRSEQATLETALEQINLGRVPRNQPPLTMQELRDELKLNGGKLPPELATVREAGKIAATTGQGMIAFSPAEVAGVLQTSPNLLSSLEPQQRKVAELVLQAQSVLGRPENKVLLADDKTGAKAKKLVTEQVQGEIQRQLRYVGNNPDNVFYIGEPSSYIGSATTPGVSSFQKYTLTQKVFNPAIAAGTSLADPNVTFNLSLEAVKRGDIPMYQAAADYSNIYKRMSALNRASTDFRKFAIALPPDGSKYVVKIDGEAIDVTDFVAVAAAMNGAMRKQENRQRLYLPPGMNMIDMNSRK